MKIFKELIIVLSFAMMVWAQESNEADSIVSKPAVVSSGKSLRPPCEHRGFFYSMGVGFSYTSFSVEKVEQKNSYRSFTDEKRRYETFNNYDKRWEFSGFDIPKFELRFGTSIGNLVALYSILDFGMYRGDGDYTDERYDRVYLIQNNEQTLASEKLTDVEKKKDDAMGFYLSFGLGLSVYPIRNLESPWNGFYVSVASGLDAFAVGFIGEHRDEETGGIFTRYEIGKDWWVSETWSVGVGFAYKNLFAMSDGNDDYSSKASRHSFHFLIRLTRG